MLWKLATFNVNGIRARLPIVIDWLTRHQPDVLCLQETKCQDRDFPYEALHSAGYVANIRGQKSYNGVAVLTRREPDEVWPGFQDGEADDEARLIAIRQANVWVVNTYVPQGRAPDDPSFQYKLNFFNRMREWFGRRFDPDQPVVWTGDLNVAPEALDVFDAQRLDGEVGFHPSDRQALADAINWGFQDVFRKLHPEERRFTFWDYRLPKSFPRNLGWRLDHILATRSLAEACRECLIDDAPRGLVKPSDHTPVWATFDLEKIA